MRVPFGLSAYDLGDKGLPALVLENWYPEVKPELGQPRLMPTPGLTQFLAATTGIRGLFQADLILSGQIVFADGASLRRVTSAGAVNTIGAVASDDFRAQFASSFVQLVASSGGTAYLVSASAATAISIPGGGPIISVAEVAQRHLFVEGGTGRFWWSGVADAATVSATSFATAENEPDALLRVEVYRDSVYLFGAKVCEMWVHTGSQDQAFVPRPGGVIPVGLIGRDAVVLTDDAIFMVDNGGIVFRLDTEGRTPVSPSDLERRIKRLSAADQARVSLSSYRWKGHEFIRVNLPGVGSWNHDLATGAWHRARSQGVETHIVSDYVEAYGTSFGAGPAAIYSLSDDVYREAGAQVRRVAEALIPIEDGRPAVDKLTVYTSVVGTPETGQGSTPEAMLQVSRDGVTFENEVRRALPGPGEYTRPTIWGPIGRAMPPVLRLRVAVTDPVGLTLGDAQLNMARS